VQEIRARLAAARTNYRRDALRMAKTAGEVARVQTAIAVADDQIDVVEAWMQRERGWRYSGGRAGSLSDHGAFAAGRAAGAGIHLGGSPLSTGPRSLGDGS
jgi:hypothetical protein